MVSHSFWQRRFGGSPGILGASITLDNRNYSVVGVLPPGFRYAGEPLAGTVSEIDVWLPLSANPLVNSIRGLRFLKAVGRLKESVPEEQARAEASRIGDALSLQYPDTDRGYAIDIPPLHSQAT